MTFCYSDGILGIAGRAGNDGIAGIDMPPALAGIFADNAATAEDNDAIAAAVSGN